MIIVHSDSYNCDYTFLYFTLPGGTLLFPAQDRNKQGAVSKQPTRPLHQRTLVALMDERPLHLKQIHACTTIESTRKLRL